MCFIQMDHIAEAKLIGRASPACADRTLYRLEFRTCLDEAGLDPGGIQRSHAGDTEAVRLPGIHQPIPKRESIFSIHPELIAKVTCEPGPRDHQPKFRPANIERSE